jgi:hypothetical protein
MMLVLIIAFDSNFWHAGFKQQAATHVNLFYWNGYSLVDWSFI